MDRKEAQEFLLRSNYEEFLEKDSDIKNVEDSDKFHATDIIGGMLCREVFDVYRDGTIVKRIEFKLLQDGTILPEQLRVGIEKIAEDKSEEFPIYEVVPREMIDLESENAKIDLINTLKVAIQRTMEEQPEAVKPIAENLYSAIQDNRVNIVGYSAGKKVTHTQSYNVAQSNIVYERKRDYVDEMYDEMDEATLMCAGLREMGIPYDDTFLRDKATNTTLKFISSCAAIGGLWAMYFGGSPMLTLAGITGYLGCNLVANKLDLKYRTAVYCLQNAYFDSQGALTKEDVKDIMMVTDYKAPDEYALACMTEEERQQLFAEAPSQLSKKAMTKRIYNALYGYQRRDTFRILKERIKLGEDKEK